MSVTSITIPVPKAAGRSPLKLLEQLARAATRGRTAAVGFAVDSAGNWSVTITTDFTIKPTPGH